MTASRLLPSCNHDKQFFVCDGTAYANFYQLVEGLKTMDERTFFYHVIGQKNDFMNWVRDVFGDQRLAKEIAKLTSPGAMAKKIESRIMVLQKR